MSDLIKRSDAINAIEHYIDEVRYISIGTAFEEGAKDGFYRAINVIKGLPSAERKGKWIRESLTTDYPYKCSACKKYSRARYDFCPNCGARMEGEQNEV